MARFFEWLAAHARPQLSPGLQRALFAAATVVFLVGGALALRNLEIGWATLRWGPLLAAAFLVVPAAIVANTYEYLISARILNYRVGFAAALRLTVISTAANLLPLPGGVLVRVQGLRGLGSNYRRAAASTALIGIAWIGVSALCAAGILVQGSRPLVGLGFAAAGVVCLVGFWGLIRRIVAPEARVRLAAATILAELAAVAVDAVRLLLVLMGLGVDVSLDQTAVLAVSASLAAATGVLPGGMGVRELIAAALAPLVGLPASAGFAATALSRIIGIFFLVGLSALLTSKIGGAEPVMEAGEPLDHA